MTIGLEASMNFQAHILPSIKLRLFCWNHLSVLSIQLWMLWKIVQECIMCSGYVLMSVGSWSF